HPLSERSRCGGMSTALEPGSDRLQLPEGLIGIGPAPCLAQPSADLRVQVIGQVPDHIALLMEPASLNEGKIPEGVADGLSPSLAPVQDQEDPARDVKASLGEVGEQPAAGRGVLGGAFLQAKDV